MPPVTSGLHAAEAPPPQCATNLPIPESHLAPCYRSNLAARNITTVKSTVDANGRNMLRPNRLKRISPGKRPRPSFSSHGKKADSTISATNIVNTQRIIVAPRTDLRSVSPPTPPSHGAQASLSLSLGSTGMRRVRAFFVRQSRLKWQNPPSYSRWLLSLLA